MKNTNWRDVLFSTRFSQVRRLQNLTQQELADIAGISRNTVVKLESCHDVKLTTIQAVSDALGAPLHVWFAPESEWSEWYESQRTA